MSSYVGLLYSLWGSTGSSWLLNSLEAMNAGMLAENVIPYELYKVWGEFEQLCDCSPHEDRALIRGRLNIFY